MNIQEALNHEAFQGARLLAGKRGLHREIKAVDVMEVPDIEEWLTEGVLLLTTFYSIKDDPEKQVEVFRALIDADAAGLVIKLGRYIHSLPEEIHNLAEKYDMPVISVPVHMPYLTIMTTLMEDTTPRKFSEDQGLFNIVKEIEKMTGAEVVVTNAFHEVVSHSRFPREYSTVLFDKLIFPKKVSDETENYYIRSDDRHSIGNIVFPLLDNYKEKGYLHIYCRRSEELLESHRSCLNSAVNVLLKILKQYEMKMDWRDCISKEDFLSSLETRDFDLQNPYTIISMDMNFAESNPFHQMQLRNVFLEHIHILLDKRFPVSAKIHDRNQFLVLLMIEENEPQDVEKKLKKLYQEVQHLFHGKPQFFISKVYRGKENIHHALDETFYLMDVKEKFQLPDTWIDSKRLGVHHYLYGLQQNEFLLQYSREIILPLLENPDQNNQYLLETLKVYLDNNGNQKKTAEELYIHRRTLTYRLKRIAELTKLDLQQADHRLMLAIAIRLVYADKKAEN